MMRMTPAGRRPSPPCPESGTSFEALEVSRYPFTNLQAQPGMGLTLLLQIDLAFRILAITIFS